MPEAILTVEAEIAFYDQDVLSTFIGSSFSNAKGEGDALVAFFAFFAARQLANLKVSTPTGFALASVLADLGVTSPDSEVGGELDGVQIVQASGTGRRGFRASLDCSNLRLKFNPYGFGLLAKGVSYYAPVSTLALLHRLLVRETTDPLYQARLVLAANLVGTAAQRGLINTRTQQIVVVEALETLIDALPDGSEPPWPNPRLVEP